MNSDSPLSDSNLPITVHQLRAEVTFKKVRDLLAAKNMEVILLKGPHLGHTVYDSPMERIYGDLDILVRPGHFARAAAMLLENGFEPFAYDEYSPEIQNDFKHWEFRSPLGIIVELHRWLSGHDRYAIESEGLFDRAETFLFARTEARGLATEDLLLHLCLHMGTSYFHVIERKHVTDIGLLLKKKSVHWPVFLQRAKKAGACSIAYYALRAAQLQENAAVPAEVLSYLRPGKIRRFWLEQSIDPGRFPLYRFPDHSLKRIKRRLLLPLLDTPGQWVAFFWRMGCTKLRMVRRVVKI